MTSVSTTTVTDPSSVNTESAGVEDAESSQGGKPTQLESGNDLTAEEEALLFGIRARTCSRALTSVRTSRFAVSHFSWEDLSVVSSSRDARGCAVDTKNVPLCCLFLLLFLKT